MEQEVEYGPDEFRAWLVHSCTRKIARHNEQRVKDLRLKLEAAARRSTDPDVREAQAELHAARTILAEVTGQDSVGGGQQ